MKIIDYELIDYLEEKISEMKRLMELAVSDTYYNSAGLYKTKKYVYEEILKKINTDFAKDEKTEDEDYIYLNEDNWMDYWGKEIEASDIKDFSSPNRIFKGRFTGYRQDNPYHYHIDTSERDLFRYARVKKEN